MIQIKPLLGNNMTNNYVYEFGDSLYLNITNRCPNNCEFCIRNIKDGVSGSDL